MTWDKEVLSVLAGGYDVRYGARSIKYEVRPIVFTTIPFGVILPSSPPLKYLHLLFSTAFCQVFFSSLH